MSFLCKANKARLTFMNTNKFKYRLYTGIAVAVFLVITMGALFYYTNVRERETEFWVFHGISVKTKLQEINTILSKKGIENRALRRYSDAANLFQDAVTDDALKSVDELITMVRDNPEQQKRAIALKKEVSELIDFWGSVKIEITRANIAAEEASFIQELKLLDEIKRSINEMDHHEEILLRKRQSDNHDSTIINNIMTIGGSTLILLVVLGLGYNISNEFKKRNNAEISLKERIAEQTRLTKQIALNNEVLLSLQGIIENSQKNTDIPSFLRTLLEGILEFTNMTSGIAYMASEDESESRLLPAVSRGVASEYVKETSLHSLLMHKHGKEAPVVYVDNVPPDFWRLSSATGTVSPGALVYLFVRLKGHLLCVFELASFRAPGEREREFLNMLPAAVAIRYAALQLTENRNQLMQELQVKQEMLLNQQEELRQSNEELLHQTQVLQASEEELRVQEEELKQMNAELEEKHDALELAKQAIDVKAVELDQSNRYKSEFLANMSHELRTPLNSILILASLLGDNKDRNLSEKQVEYARIIGNSGTDLLKLINDILDLSKIEAGKVELSIEEVSVSTIVNHMKETFDVMAELKKVTFQVNVADDVSRVFHTDMQRLEQIIKNLLSNAIKFTPEGGKVSLAIEMADANRLLFKVTDTGIGIDASKLELIFEAFKQEDGSTNRKYGGTGLGLSISRELAKMLKGTLTVESTLKKGSTFQLSLPLIIAEEQSSKPIAQNKPLPKIGESRQLSGAEKTILIVEDDPNFSNILKNFAEEKSYKTLVAFNGKEGLEMARQHKPDAIILDLQMPVMNGWDVLKELRVDKELRGIPVHVISAMDEDKAPVNGIVEYVRKPVTIDELEHTFKHIGSYIAAVKHRLLIWSTDHSNDDTIKQLITNMPGEVQFDRVADIQELIDLGKNNHYDCILADVSMTDEHYENLQSIRENNLFSGTSLILLIDQEISATNEMRLKKISEAIVMKSKEAHNRLKDELEIFMLHVKEHKPEIAAEKEPFTESNLDGKKVLVADDDMRNVFALVGLLENHKMEVVTASNGIEALEALENDPDIDIVLMDIMMPEMDGYEAMKKIRSDKRHNDLPIIALTAKAMSNDRELCIEAGASDYMSKPVNSQKLLSLIRIWLS